MFFKIESWNCQVQFEIKIRETSQNFNSFSLFRQLLFSSFFIGCLIELKFCKVSWNSISNWIWKFQLSILKNKKVLFLEKKLSRRQYQNKKAFFTDSIFPKVLVHTMYFWKVQGWNVHGWNFLHYREDISTLDLKYLWLKSMGLKLEKLFWVRIVEQFLDK